MCFGMPLEIFHFLYIIITKKRIIYFIISKLIYRTPHKYLKVLRHCEYHCNNDGILNNMLYRYYKVRLHRLGFKYNIRIPENICGYGLSILHIAGCGGCLVNAKKVGNYCK